MGVDTVENVVGVFEAVDVEAAMAVEFVAAGVVLLLPEHRLDSSPTG